MRAVNRRPRHATPLSGRLFFIVAAGLLCVKVVPADVAMAPIRLVDGQTAGVVPKGDYNVESRIYKGGGTGTGLLVDVMVGIPDRFSLEWSRELKIVYQTPIQ